MGRLLRVELGRRKTKLSSYTTVMLPMGYAADYQGISLLSEAYCFFEVFYNMTKLTEWIVFAGLAFSIWITLLTDILPLKVSYKAKEVIWPVRSKNSLNKTVDHKKTASYLGLNLINL